MRENINLTTQTQYTPTIDQFPKKEGRYLV